MTLVDWIQFVSGLLVAAALVATVLQLREVSRQSRVFLTALQHNGHVTGKEDLRITFFREDPELLSWYLRSRGYKTTTPVEDRCRLYILAKLNLHEARFVERQSGLLGGQGWDAWAKVIAADISLPEFQEVWQTAREIHTATFVAFVDGQVASITATHMALGIPGNAGQTSAV
jgi:hypothetical protein